MDLCSRVKNNTLYSVSHSFAALILVYFEHKIHISSQQSIIPPYSLQSETAMHISHSFRQNREIIVQVVIKASALAQW
jgi:hypothetical protein